MCINREAGKQAHPMPGKKSPVIWCAAFGGCDAWASLRANLIFRK
jgi:hypothetical protein